VTLTVAGRGLQFARKIHVAAPSPDPPDALKPALVREGQRLLRLHRSAAEALARIVDGLGADAGLWLRLRDRLSSDWRDDVPQFKYFMSWIASQHMRADASKKLQRTRSTFVERASWRADITFNDRMIAFLTPRLLNLALLNPALHHEITTRKIPKHRGRQK
jgi:hypothetical protein